MGQNHANRAFHWFRKKFPRLSLLIPGLLLFTPQSTVMLMRKALELMTMIAASAIPTSGREKWPSRYSLPERSFRAARRLLRSTELVYHSLLWFETIESQAEEQTIRTQIALPRRRAEKGPERRWQPGEGKRASRTCIPKISESSMTR